MTFALFRRNNQDFSEFPLKIAMNSYDFCIFQVPQCVDELLLYQNHSKSLIFPMTFELFLNINVLMIGFCMGIAWFPYDFLRIPKMNTGFFTKSLSDLANRLAIRSPEIAYRWTIAKRFSNEVFMNRLLCCKSLSDSSAWPIQIYENRYEFI